MTTVDQQMLRGVAGAAEFTIFDTDGDPNDAATGVTVGVVTADGTQLVAAGTAATDAGTSRPGVWTTALTAANLASLNLLTATWKDSGGNTVDVTTHEIVGGFYFSEADFREHEKSGKSFDSDTVKRARRRVEEDFERICDVAFVPRYARDRLSGSGSSVLLLPRAKVRTIRSVRVYSDATTYTAFNSDALAALDIDGDVGITVTRLDGNTWTTGDQNVVIEYEHGHTRPPQSVKEAAMRYARHVLTQTSTGLSQRFIVQEGSTIGLARPGAWATGLDDVDSVLARFSLRIPGVA